MSSHLLDRTGLGPWLCQFHTWRRYKIPYHFFTNYGKDHFQLRLPIPTTREGECPTTYFLIGPALLPSHWNHMNSPSGLSSKKRIVLKLLIGLFKNTRSKHSGTQSPKLSRNDSPHEATLKNTFLLFSETNTTSERCNFSNCGKFDRFWSNNPFNNSSVFQPGQALLGIALLISFPIGRQCAQLTVRWARMTRHVGC